MSGRSYTMREMRSIVDYLTEHNAYKEIRGRKMWMDFANSQLTRRTWQSLKETFLKRILPDIHNPYYGLSQDQVYSFRRGVDLPSKAKLEIHTISDDSSSNAENQNNQEASTSKAIDEEQVSGEDNINSKNIARDRASVETVIIDNCYDTAEDIRRVLDSPTTHSNEDDECNKLSNKSLRDLITYSEPLTPMLQEVLHDFDSDEESEPRLQIVEKSPCKTSDQEMACNNSSDKPSKKVEESPRKKTKTENNAPWRMTDANLKSDKSTSAKTSPKLVFDNAVETSNGATNSRKLPDISEENPPKIKSLRLRKKHANSDKYVVASEPTDLEKPNTDIDMDNIEGSTHILSQNNEPSIAINDENETKIAKSPLGSTQNFPNGTNDSELPNNQEAFGNPIRERGIDHLDSQKTTLISMDPSKITRKRTSLQEVSCDSKRQFTINNNVLKSISMSDTDINVKKSDTNNKSKVNSNEESQKVDKVMKSPETDTTNNISENKSPKRKDLDSETPPSLLNPCLQSVSLYEAQFNMKNYVSSSDDDEICSKTTNEKFEKQKKSAEDQNVTEAKNNVTEKVKEKSVNHVVILNSHSESDSISENTPEKKVTSNNKDLENSQRSKALADVFGFSSGAVTTKRPAMKHTKSNHQHTRSSTPTDCSDWTSDSDSDYISPPRGRRNSRARKYLKPKSARIHSLEEEGGLFVMYGKRIYPLVKDGKTMKNYLTYNPESDPEEEDNYWKQKYIDEKQRVEELKMVVNQTKLRSFKEKSPILPLKSPRKSTSGERDLPPVPINSTSDIPKEASVEKENQPRINKTLKITFTKNNQEVQLEGHWSQLHPVLADVVEIFHKDVAPMPASSKFNEEPKPIDLVSDISAPDDASDVHEKVNKLETEIFKEIEDKAVEEKDEIVEDKNEIMEEKEEKVKEVEGNVTLRKRQLSRSRSPTPNPPLSANVSPSVSHKKLKTSKSNDVQPATYDVESKNSEISVVTEKAPGSSKKAGSRKGMKPSPKKTDGPKGETLSPKKGESLKGGKLSPKKGESLGEKSSPQKEESVGEKPSPKKEENPKGVKPSPKKAESPKGEKQSLKKAESLKGEKLSAKKGDSLGKKPSPKKEEDPKEAVPTITAKPRKIKSKTQAEEKIVDISDDDEIRYKFPKNRKPNMKYATKSTKAKEQKQYTRSIPKIFASPNLSVNSDSTQGYLDSDISPPKFGVRRKRRLSLASVGYRNKRSRVKRKSYPIIDDDVSSDSHQSFKIILKTKDDFSLKSEVYKSDSYQLLMSRKSLFKPLEKIDELNPMRKEDSDNPSIPLNSGTNELHINISKITDDIASTSSRENPDGMNSSNVSLPLSPELSIVEKISISRDLVNNSVVSQPTLNEIQAINATDEVNKYLISEVDVSMPLMQQECGFLSKSNGSSPKDKNGRSDGSVTESLLNKINTVNIDEAQTLSESLDIRLRNLLLESAKKMSEKYESGDVDSTDNKKARANKRCSTPRKKKEVKKKVPPKVDPVIEEEYMESCSYGGRKSCPPSIYVVNNDLSNVLQKNIDETKPVAKKKSIGRKKKDIIKVKILRPKDKYLNVPSKTDKLKVRQSKLTVPNKTTKRKSIPLAADSGINDTGSSLSHLNDSVDLIHNHSETCLQAHECIHSDSVEFIETTANSIISLNSNSTSSVGANLKPILSPKIFCTDAEKHENQLIGTDNEKSAFSSEDEFHSPVTNEISINSLITEDLSDEMSPQPSATNWYLLSEDDTNTNLCLQPTAGSVGFTSNLKQLFPVTCAVPDLSTITEISKDNETSKKRTLEFSNCDSNTMDDLDSQNIFDINY